MGRFRPRGTLVGAYPWPLPTPTAMLSHYTSRLTNGYRPHATGLKPMRRAAVARPDS